MSSYQEGLAGEQQAEDYLKARGLQVVMARYRGGNGEIDLIARDGDVLCFIEVKYRPHGRLGDGMLAVSTDKRRRMHRAAKDYLQVNAYRGKRRYDALEITRAGVWYIKNGAQLT